VTTATERARLAGITPADGSPPQLACCVVAGNLVFTSGHTSSRHGTLGVDVDVPAGAEAAREAMGRVIGSVWHTVGTLDGLRVVSVQGAVRSDTSFTDHPRVLDGATELAIEVFGADAGRHARCALGHASLPAGAAVEVAVVFERTAGAGPAGGAR
jgi:enamine deaminase RidA (YjgF/YER057c/UK114 family)